MPQNDPQHETEYDTLPPALADALREMDGQPVMPDAQRDAEVLSGARRHLAEHAGGLSRKRRSRLRLFIGGAAGGAVAAAAMVGIVVLIGEPTGREDAAPAIADQTTPQRSTEPAAPARPGDLNADDRLDILDAYTLARQIERGDASDKADLNGDGQIDQQDIDWIATRAVALNLGGQG